MADEKIYNRRGAVMDAESSWVDKMLGFERGTNELVSLLNNKVSLMEAEQRHMIKSIDQLVSRTEFTPVKLLVYGMTSIALASVIAAVIALVVHK